MSEAVHTFSDEQLRVIANLEQHYDAWLDAERAVRRLPYGMHWKTVSGRDYLYRVLDRAGNANSLGPRSDATDAEYERYRAEKQDLKDRIDGARSKLLDDSRLYRALRLPRIASAAAAILREADRCGLLGASVMVIGTNAMPAYAIEAGGRIGDAPDTTDDFDLAWISETSEGADRPLWAMLHAVDSTYTVNTEKPFQARNRDAYEVEILVAPSRIGGMQRKDRPKPVALPEQEWLLRGDRVNRVVIGQDGAPARIVAPDPRWYALQKLWMSEQAKRNAVKRPKDRRQGIALMNAVQAAMPHFPLGSAFEAALPPELKPHFDRWKTDSAPAQAARW